MRYLVMLGAALLLAACSSLPPLTETPEMKAKEDAATCTSYGIQSGTPLFSECMMRAAQTRAIQEAQRRQQGMALLGMSSAWMQAAQPQQPAMGFNNPIHCTSSQQGQFTNTNCY